MERRERVVLCGLRSSLRWGGGHVYGYYEWNEEWGEGGWRRLWSWVTDGHHGGSRTLLVQARLTTTAGWDSFSVMWSVHREPSGSRGLVGWLCCLASKMVG